jgi:predicted nucleic acid-binding protein
VILVDTSVWVDHLRRGHSRLGELLERGEVLIHPHVIGELACGNLRNRSEILELLRRLPIAPTVTDGEALDLIQQRRLWGKGLGWIDVHLLGSALLAHAPLWTLDKALAAAAEELGLTPNA